MIGKSQYREALSAIIIPANIIATSDELGLAKNVRWFNGADRDLAHVQWHIRTANPEKLRKADQYVSFNAALDFRHGWTGGVTTFQDALTMRVVCVELLKGNGTAKPVAAAQIVKIAGSLEWLIRWRNAVGIHSIRDLTEQHYRQFVTDASTTDITDLIPLVERIEILAEDPDYRLPLYEHGKRYRMHWETFAHTLGVTRWNLGQSRKFHEAFRRNIAGFLCKGDIEPGVVDFYVKPTQGRPSVKARPFSRVGAWDTLERLSLRGRLEQDYL
jgi:hypothetical protein